MCIVLQHSAIDRILHYCWGPVSSFKKCVWPATRDISSLYGRLIPNETTELFHLIKGLSYTFFLFTSFLVIPVSSGIFHLKRSVDNFLLICLGRRKVLTFRLLVIYSVLSRCKYQEVEHNWVMCHQDSESFAY